MSSISPTAGTRRPLWATSWGPNGLFRIDTDRGRLESMATMKIPFEQPPTAGVPASFVISDCMVSETAPTLPVRIKANGKLVGEWTLGPDREVHRRSVNLPAEIVAGAEELILTFEIPAPRSPASLGWNSDSRLLGMRLARAVIGRADIEMPVFGKRTRSQTQAD